MTVVDELFKQRGDDCDVLRIDGVIQKVIAIFNLVSAGMGICRIWGESGQHIIEQFGDKIVYWRRVKLELSARDSEQ